ncbi:hypothetical protein ACI79P_08645 [Blastococcus sp. SYSU DS0510]
MSAEVAEATGASVASETAGRSAPRQRGGRLGPLLRAPDWLVALGVGVLTAVIGTIPQWRGEHFFYVGDQVEQFAPLWHVFGEQLRDGRWPTMDPAGWVGGNYAAEALLGIWNPVNLLNFVLVSFFEDLSLASAVVMIEMLAVLAAGVFLLAREYGAGRIPAVLVATAVPVSGFTLWYEASGWPAGLFAFTWVTHFWWAARRHSRGRLNPFVPFLFGALAMTTGSPYAALGLVVVLGAIAVELLLQRRFARLAHLVVMGACVGALALAVFLPLLGTNPVSARQTLAVVANDTFLVPDVGDLVAASSPTYLPAMLNWNGALVERVPSTYFAWFVLPLLPWLRWHALRRPPRSLVSLAVVGGFFLLATLGPSNLWLFRWPVRLIEHLYLAAAVCFAVVLSAGLATDRVRRRAAASGAVVLVGAYLAWAVRPAEMDRIHLAGLLLVAALVAAALASGLRRGMPALGAVGVVGTVLVLFLQTSTLPQPAPDPATYPPHDLDRMAAGAVGYEGTVLQLAALEGVTSEQMARGEILFGNLPRAAGARAVGSYSGIGFLEFGTELCMDYRGAVCPEAFDRLWEPAGEGIPVPLVDAMQVSTLVIQRSLLPGPAAQEPPPGWQVLERDDVRTVWVREQPLDDTGRVSWSSPGVEVLETTAGPQRETVRYDAGRAGRIAFARLAWPGYTATVDGREVELVDGPAGLIVAEVPEGEGTLVLTHRPPGLRAGAAVAAGAATVAALQTLLWFRSLRRRTSRGETGTGVRSP